MSEGSAEVSTEKKNGFASAAAWHSRAEAYVVIMENRHESGIRVDTSLGRNLVVDRVVDAAKNKESPVVLDVAAGGGEPALSIAKAMPHAQVHGTDFAPAMVDCIRKRGEEAGVANLTASVEDATQLSGIEDETVDAVTCTWGMETSPDPMAVLRQFHRVLRVGGLAVFAAWEKAPNAFAMKITNVMNELQGNNKMTTGMFSLGNDGGDVAKKAMEETGFVEVKVSKIDIPLRAPAGTRYSDIFECLTNPTPIEVVLAAMESHGRPKVREEACAIFEAQMEKDKAEGKLPRGPGLPAPGEPAHDENEPVFYFESLIVEGRKAE